MYSNAIPKSLKQIKNFLWKYVSVSFIMKKCNCCEKPFFNIIIILDYLNHHS